MFTRHFQAEPFLRTVYGTEPFFDYCRRRGISFAQKSSATVGEADFRHWTEALARLPQDEYARIELELAMVNEMATPEGVAHLTAAAAGWGLPPEVVPTGAPLSLWYFLHHPGLFREAFLHHDTREPEDWPSGHAPAGLILGRLWIRGVYLAAALRKFFRTREGIGRYCTVDYYRLRESYCFFAHIADRPHLLDAFTDHGRLATRQLWPALPVVFLYFPMDGMVLLRSHVRSIDGTAELLKLFGKAALGKQVRSEGRAFNLEVLKRPFHPPLDGEDMEQVRVKALHLRYPERFGRRQVKIETLAGDGPYAINQLLRSHVGADNLEQLSVCGAELQIRMRVEGGSKNFLIRLRPDRCDLGETFFTDRFRVCLKRWGLLCHDGKC